MGYIRHHGMLITTYKEELTAQVRAKAVEIFGDLVSEARESTINGYWLFAVFPDGSKEGWEDSDKGDANRAAFKAWTETLRYEDGSTSVDWVEVQYGDDNGETCIVAGNDYPEEATVVDAVVMLPE